MRVAVITPCHAVSPAWLEQCLASVRQQQLSCTHFLILDGDGRDVPTRPRLQVLRLPSPHADAGNAARAIGSVSAICQGFDALAYLDADNWYEANHLALLASMHQQTGASVCSSRRTLYGLDSNRLGLCPEVDGEQFVDTNCLFLARPAFAIVAEWFLMPSNLVRAGDRVVWRRIKTAPLRRAHHDFPTVNDRTRYAAHYRFFGQPLPHNACETVQLRLGWPPA